MSLSAGELRHVIDIQQKVVAQDPITLEQTVTWQNVAANIRAAIKDLSVREFIAAQKEDSELSTKIIIRHRPGLRTDMRIVCRCGCHQGAIFNIQGLLNDPFYGVEYLTIPVMEGLNDG